MKFRTKLHFVPYFLLLSTYVLLLELYFIYFESDICHFCFQIEGLRFNTLGKINANFREHLLVFAISDILIFFITVK